MSEDKALEALEKIEQYIISLQDETYALRADALRYRWLRKHDVLPWSRGADRKAPFAACFGAALDGAIDAAMTEKQ